MSPLHLILLTGLAGCDNIGQSAAGQWSGTCSLEAQSSYDEPGEVLFDLDVFEVADGKIKGDGSFFFDHYEFEGKVRGYRDNEKLELELEGSYEGHSTRLEITGDIIDNRVRGWCSFYGVSGSLEMSR